MMQIVILDGYTANPGDLSWDAFHELGEVTIYDRTKPDELLERAIKADILITNKCQINAPLMEQLPKLKCICLLATGYNNIDIAYANKKNIPVFNAAGYSTSSVAQHVFALILSLVQRVDQHHQSVNDQYWSTQDDFSYSLSSISELKAKTMGIYGLGKIGTKVASIALAFEMKVIATKRNPQKGVLKGVHIVDEHTLLSESDILSLHAPLSKENTHFINTTSLSKMKNSALLINTGRGDLVLEEALANALKNNQLGGAGLDVMSSEPPPADHPLFNIQHCIITPHQAWASIESRSTLLHMVAQNIRDFQKGNWDNRL